MKKYKIPLFVIALLALTNSSFSQYQIGHTTITFQDPNRSNRNIETEIYYPASTTGDNVPAAQDTFPVIVFGHGFVMAWDAYENLWNEFVPRGYIMAFPRTEGNMFSTDHQQFGWDLQFLVTEIQTEGANSASILYGVVAAETALMGHSMGGGAAFLAADSLTTNGNQNIKTLVGLAPAESSSNGVSSINSAKSVTVPAVVLSGSQDGVTPPVDHHIPMYDSLASACKTFINILGGAHCYFAEPNLNCDFGESTSSSGISITRTEQHQTTFDFVNLWLDYTLKNDCNVFDVFNDSLTNSARITSNQQCYANLTPGISFNTGVLTCTVTGVNYQWYLNGNPISGANQINYTPTQSGNYTVEVFFQDGCSKVSAPYNYTTTSVNELKKNSLMVYPNPATTEINIKGLRNEHIDIYTTEGKSLEYEMINESKIDVSAFQNGIYIIKVGVNYYRFIKY